MRFLNVCGRSILFCSFSTQTPTDGRRGLREVGIQEESLNCPIVSVVQYTVDEPHRKESQAWLLQSQKADWYPPFQVAP